MTGGAWLSSARVVRCWVKSRNERNPYLQSVSYTHLEMVDEGLLTKEEALMKVDPKQLDQILHPAFDQKALKAATPVSYTHLLFLLENLLSFCSF